MGIGTSDGRRCNSRSKVQRQCKGHLLHAVAPVEPMLKRRFIRHASEAPVALGVKVGGCSRGNAETEPRRLEAPVEPIQRKTRRRFNRWLRKISAELQTLLLIQIFKNKALNTQFGPFSRDNLTPQTLILSARKLLHRHKQIKIQARLKHKKPNV